MTNTPGVAEMQARLLPLADELVTRGAETVWLAGSFARGEPGPHSDVDVGAIAAAGAGPGYRLENRDGVLFSISWTTADATRRSFENPATLGAAVPGWRKAVMIRDLAGTGARLQGEARTFTWDQVASSCDRWVAEQATGYAEEVHKLCNALHRSNELTAAVQRNVLVNRLPFVLSVHRRILYDSENVLWSLVAEALGEPWTSAQATALCVAGGPFDASLRAALRLYLLAVAEVEHLLDARQRAVVSHASGLARDALGVPERGV